LTVSLSANWVGTGEISRDTETSHFKPPTVPNVVSNTVHTTFRREATATGSFDGQELGTAGSAFPADNHGVNVCVNCSY
jgi:hypothetical protein